MKNIKKYQLGVADVLFLIFLVLKLTKNIDWNWFFIFLPIIISVILGIIIFILQEINIINIEE